MGKIIIKKLKVKSKQLDKFKLNAWKQIHPEHYGVSRNNEYWTNKELILEASDEGKIIGVLIGDLMGGVFSISELIVDKRYRRQNIGKKLLNEAEVWAKNNKAHKIYTETGVNWKARKFYESMGFETGAVLSNHYSKIDFIALTKFLE